MLYWFVGMLLADPVDIYLTAEDLRHYDLMLEEALGRYDEVRLLGQAVDGSWVEAYTLLPEAVPLTEKYLIPAPRIGVDHPGESAGALSGKAVYLSQCHGWIYYDSLERFSTQRGNLHDTIEDFHNPEGMNQFLLQYLENAGASVFTAKERDLNVYMSIADNDGEGYSEEGSGFEDAALGFRDDSPWLYGENPFDAGTTRQFPADSGSVATWIPDVPAEGYYAVYVSWDSDPTHAPDAHYRITHNGGVIDRYFDQRIHGSTWQYVEYLWLEPGVDSLMIELIADSTHSGTYLNADAVRVGGGMGDVWRSGGGTDRPRWEEGAILYTQFNGAPTSVYDPYNYGDGSDPSARSRWAAWEHPSGEDALYLSWHSNAGGGTGTDTFYDDSGPVAGSEELSTFVHEQLIDSIRTLHDSEWRDRGVKTANFAEVNSSYNNEMPSTLVELGFHDSEYDTQFLLDPIFRRDASRAMYRGIAEYFAYSNGATPVFLPEPPINLRVVQEAGQVQIDWNEGLIGAPYGDAPSSYVVYLSRDGRSWGNGTEVSTTSLSLEFATGAVRYVRVAAVNEGGISFPSETLAFGKEEGTNTPPILIVSAFDRLQRSTLFWADAGVVGSVQRMDLRRINAFDSIVNTAEAIGLTEYPFDSISDEELSSLQLDDYQLIIWIAGEESTFDSTFTEQDQDILSGFVAGGGKLIVSGAEIFWDLDYQGDENDQDFALSVLGAGMASDDADSYLANGEGILAGIEMNFSFEEGSSYNVEYPDVLDSAHPVIARYDTGTIGGIYTGTVAVFGFPLEAIISLDARKSTFEILLNDMLSDYVSPDPEVDDTGVVDSDSEEDTAQEQEEECGCREKNRSSQAMTIFPLLLWIGYRRKRS